MKHDCNVSVIFWLDIIPSKKSPRLIFLSSFCLQKKRLIQLYGKNQLSNNKLRIAEEFALGKSLTQLASEMGIAKATAEVYAIDCLAAGRKIDHEQLASFLALTADAFQRIKVTILSNEDNRLRTIRDSLSEEFCYNQIRFVLACLIHELEL